MQIASSAHCLQRSFHSVISSGGFTQLQRAEGRSSHVRTAVGSVDGACGVLPSAHVPSTVSAHRSLRGERRLANARLVHEGAEGIIIEFWRSAPCGRLQRGVQYLRRRRHPFGRAEVCRLLLGHRLQSQRARPRPLRQPEPRSTACCNASMSKVRGMCVAPGAAGADSGGGLTCLPSSAPPPLHSAARRGRRPPSLGRRA